VELLVVVAIMAVLLTILMPALSRAREQARRAVCQGHMRTLGKALIMYGVEYNDRIPPLNPTDRFSQDMATFYLYYQTWHAVPGPSGPGWLYKARILEDPGEDLMFCPSYGKNASSKWYYNVNFNCKGDRSSWNYVGPGSTYGWYLRPEDADLGWMNLRCSYGWRNMAELGITKWANAKSMAYLSDRWMATNSIYRSHITDLPHVSPSTNDAFMNVLFCDGHVETRRWSEDKDFDSDGMMMLGSTWRDIFDMN